LSWFVREPPPSTAKEVVLFANPDFDLASKTMLAEADNRSSAPGAKRLRGSEKREIEDWRFGSLDGTQRGGAFIDRVCHTAGLRRAETFCGVIADVQKIIRSGLRPANEH
jgi:hypothetical protein